MLKQGLLMYKTVGLELSVARLYGHVCMGRRVPTLSCDIVSDTSSPDGLRNHSRI